jgi:hypothetical protein
MALFTGTVGSSTDSEAQFNSGKIRTVFCTSGGLIGSALLRRLLSDEDIEVVGMVRSCRVFSPKMNFVRGALQFFFRCGIPYTIYLWLITTIPEFIGLFLSDCHGSTLGIAKKHAIPVLTTRDMNSLSGENFIHDLKPELLITAFFDQKLGLPFCDGANYAAVNIHPSFLPLNKGVDPLFHAILDGDPTSGVTVHKINENFDSGAIIKQKQLPIDPTWSVLFASITLMDVGMELLLSSKDLLLNREAGMPQSGPGTYQSWPTSKKVRSLYSQGKCLMSLDDIKKCLLEKLT